MKRIGLVGGMSPESTKEYYALLIDMARPHMEGALNNPEIIIYSINLSEFFAYMEGGRPERATDLLVGIIGHLRTSGAEIGALTANTPHVLFEDIKERVELPLVSILDTTLDGARERGAKRALLLGTRITMESDMYPEHFGKEDIDIVVPGPDDMEFVHRSIVEELTTGQILPRTRERYLDLCRGHIESHGVDCVILGCTEIPLIIREDDLPVPLLDTTRLHARAILNEALGPEGS